MATINVLTAETRMGRVILLEPTVANRAGTLPLRLLVAARHAHGIADPVVRQRACEQLALTMRRLGYDRPDAAALGIDV